jgi:hypothetical protein
MDNLSKLHRPIHFTIDGRSYTTNDHKQPARDLLRLAGLDPAHFDLGELKGHRPEPVRYSDDNIVTIHDKHRADVA